jgi:sugar transferase EpsL
VGRLAKRLFDLLVATVLMVALGPLTGLIALCTLFLMGPPVLFRQVRPGYGAKPFTLLKFRTMRDGRDAEGRLLPDAERLTAMGKLMRRLSLDELPQLWNVWKGEMSLVGPRPLLMEYLDRYTAEQMRRHEMKPGVTGWAQVNGRNALSWEARFRLDLWYVDHWSLGLDLKIILKTIRSVLLREGISQNDHATMPEFMGSDRGRL